MQHPVLNRKTDGIRQRILVVERSRTIQTALSMTFGNAGYEVLACTTPLEALRLLEDVQGRLDCIFLAMQAQEQDDYKVIHAVNAQ